MDILLVAWILSSIIKRYPAAVTGGALLCIMRTLTELVTTIPNETAAD